MVGEFDEGEIVGVVLLVAGRDGAEVFDPCEEPLDPVAPPVDGAIERWRGGAAWDRLDDGAGANALEVVPQAIAVIGGVRDEGLSCGQRVEHVLGGAPVMRLSRRQLESDRKAARIGHGMDLGGQAAPRTPQADGSKVNQIGGSGALRAPLFAFAPCW